MKPVRLSEEEINIILFERGQKISPSKLSELNVMERRLRETGVCHLKQSLWSEFVLKFEQEDGLKWKQISSMITKIIDEDGGKNRGEKRFVLEKLARYFFSQQQSSRSTRKMLGKKSSVSQ